MSTKQNGANATFAVARPIGNSGRAQITSLHRKEKTARAEIDRQNKALRKKPGQSQSWVDRIVVRVPAGVAVGENVALDRAAPVGRKPNGGSVGEDVPWSTHIKGVKMNGANSIISVIPKKGGFFITDGNERAELRSKEAVTMFLIGIPRPDNAAPIGLLVAGRGVHMPPHSPSFMKKIMRMAVSHGVAAPTNNSISELTGFLDRAARVSSIKQEIAPRAARIFKNPRSRRSTGQ